MRSTRDKRGWWAVGRRQRYCCCQWLDQGGEQLCEMGCGWCDCDQSGSCTDHSIYGGVLFADNNVTRGEVGTDIAAYGDSTIDVSPGVLVHAGLPGSWYASAALLQQLTKCSPSVYLGRVPCQVGEYGASGLCQCCPVHQFGFELDALSCMACPAHAVCPGGAVITPAEGYWHSTVKSVQMHRCPGLTTACKAHDTCGEGYTGNLCGACAYGFGQTLPFACSKCMAPAKQLAVYCVLVLLTVLFISLTVHFTWQDNKLGDKTLRPSDLIKVLVQFLQYLVILGSLSVPWPKFMTGLYSAATLVFGAASGQASLLDCWLKYYSPTWLHIPVAVQRQLVYFVASLCILVAVMLVTYAITFAKRLLYSTHVWSPPATTETFCGASLEQAASGCAGCRVLCLPYSCQSGLGLFLRACGLTTAVSCHTQSTLFGTTQQVIGRPTSSKSVLQAGIERGL